MKALFVAFLVTLGMVGLWTVAIPCAQAQSAEDATASDPATFAIENMTCVLCPVTVPKAMQGVSGVKSVSVDLEQNKATAVFDSGTTSVAAIAAASTEAGYPAAAVGQ